MYDCIEVIILNLFFDEDCQQIIIEAKQEMLQLNHPYVGSEHLVLSILKREDLDVTRLLHQYSITYDDFRNKLIESVGIGNSNNQWFLFTPMLRKILSDASNLYSKDFGLVTPYSLFMTILKEGDGVANRILLSMNVDLDALYQCFLSSKKILISSSLDLLNQYAINMNLQSSKYEPVIGREKEISDIIRVLIRKNKSNPLLLGEAGVGKTAIIEELSRRISSKNVPFCMQNSIIFNLSMSSLISGTKYRGEFEERFQKIIDEVKNNPNIILFIDEFHTVIGAGGAEGAIDASNIIKPYLARGDIKVIGATTIQEYSKWISKDKAFDRRFQKIYIEEASKKEVKNILYQLKPVYEQFHHVIISKTIIEQILSYSYRYLFFGNQPDKTIDFLDEVCVYAISKIDDKDKEYYQYSKQIKDIVFKKNHYILLHDFSKAKQYRNKEQKIRHMYSDSLLDYKNHKLVSITRDDLNHALYERTKIPIGSLMSNLVVKCFQTIKQEYIVQKKVLQSLQNYLKRTNYLQKNNSLNLLFGGKKGVGKTFLARKIAEGMVGKSRVYYFSFQDFLSKESFFQAIEKKIVLSSLQNNPFSFIILDNIIFSNASLLNAINSILGSGVYVSTDGENYNFTKCIFILITQSNFNSIGFVSHDNGNHLYKEMISKVHFSCLFEDILPSTIRRYVSDYCNRNHYDDECFHSLFRYVITHHKYKLEGLHHINQVIDQYFSS